MSKALIIALCLACTANAQSTSGITVAPSALTFAYQIGAALPAAQTLQVQTAPKGLSFTVAVSGAPFNAAWLLVSASVAKSPASLKVTVNPTGLTPGSYVGTLTFTAVSGATTLTQNTTVTLRVTNPPATISVTPSALSFTYITGHPIPSPSLTSAFILSSDGAAVPAIVTVTAAPWLTIAPTGNITLVGLFNSVGVTVDPTGLQPKVYTGQITITASSAANKSVTVGVTLTVNAATPQAFSTWPLGLIQGSAASVVTVTGSNFFSTTTSKVTGFTPAATITVNDGATNVSETFLIPVYQSAAVGLRLAVGSPLPSGVVGTAYSKPLAAAGGTGPYTYAIIGGSIPPGLAIAGTNFAGTPTSPGTFFFTIQVTDSTVPPIQAYSQVKMTVYPAGSIALRITVAAAPIPLGSVGIAYGPVTLTVAGGTGGPYVWSSSALPVGLVLSSVGVLSGSPSTDGAGPALAGSIISDADLLATVPAASLAIPGVLRIAVTTPTPGGGTSNEAQFQVFGPDPQITAVVNSASFQQGTLAPGDVIAIFGLGLGPATLTIFDPSTPPIPTSLPAVAPSTSVTINGTPASLIYTTATVVGVIVPYTLVGATAQVVVTYNGLVSQPFTLATAVADPGIYSIASSGQGQGAILNFNAVTGDFSVNSSGNAAARGSIVVIYMTGAGATTSAVSNLLIPASPAVTPLLAPSVTIGGQPAAVLAAQAPPGSIPGLIQLNVTVPATLTPGAAQPVIVTVGGINSQTGLTMAVK